MVPLSWGIQSGTCSHPQDLPVIQSLGVGHIILIRMIPHVFLPISYPRHYPSSQSYIISQYSNVYVKGGCCWMSTGPCSEHDTCKMGKRRQIHPHTHTHPNHSPVLPPIKSALNPPGSRVWCPSHDSRPPRPGTGLASWSSWLDMGWLSYHVAQQNLRKNMEEQFHCLNIRT